MRDRYFSTFQLILLALLAALSVVAKIALRLPLQLPGHTGIFWMAIVIVAAGIVPRVGAASLVGLTSGILAAFLGLGDFGALNTLLSYTAVGVVADLGLVLLGRRPENLAVAVLAAWATWASSWSSGRWVWPPAPPSALWPWGWPALWSVISCLGHWAGCLAG
jgi:ABC-type thiamin/hydroxymethylpyrimidine transport system permease subunit